MSTIGDREPGVAGAVPRADRASRARRRRTRSAARTACARTRGSPARDPSPGSRAYRDAPPRSSRRPPLVRRVLERPQQRDDDRVDLLARSTRNLAASARTAPSTSTASSTCRRGSPALAMPTMRTRSTSGGGSSSQPSSLTRLPRASGMRSSKPAVVTRPSRTPARVASTLVTTVVPSPNRSTQREELAGNPCRGRRRSARRRRPRRRPGSRGSTAPCRGRDPRRADGHDVGERAPDVDPDPETSLVLHQRGAGASRGLIMDAECRDSPGGRTDASFRRTHGAGYATNSGLARTKLCPEGGASSASAPSLCDSAASTSSCGLAPGSYRLGI